MAARARAMAANWQFFRLPQTTFGKKSFNLANKPGKSEKENEKFMKKEILYTNVKN